MSEKDPHILQFPESDDCFVWRDNKGELLRYYKGNYAIIRMPDGSYRTEYINPDLGEWEDAVLEFGDIESPGEYKIIEKRRINSRKDYEELLQRIEDLKLDKR